MGRQINLETCTKEQLIARINYMLKTARNDLFIHLENKYCSNPRLLFDRDDKTTYLGKIMVVDSTCSELNKLVNYCFQYECYFDTVESFVDDLFDNYIKDVYQ